MDRENYPVRKQKYIFTESNPCLFRQLCRPNGQKVEHEGDWTGNGELDIRIGAIFNPLLYRLPVNRCMCLWGYTETKAAQRENRRPGNAVILWARGVQK